MKLWVAPLFLLGACTSAPRQETSEQKLAAQARAIEQAANQMVNAAIADFDVTEISQDAGNQATTDSDDNQSKAR